jgi:hypothetical protein
MPWLGLSVSNTGPSTDWLTKIQMTAAATSPTANHFRQVMGKDARGTEQG